MALQLPEGLSWVPVSEEPPAEEGVVCGTSDGCALRVARCRKDEETGTACLLDGASEAIMGFFGKAVAESEYDLLVNTSAKLHWVPACAGELPAHAVGVGKDVQKRIIYVARIKAAGLVVPAKLICEFFGAFGGWDAKEYFRKKYEVLCYIEEGEDAEECDVHEVPAEEPEVDDGHGKGELEDERKHEIETPEGLAWCYGADGATFDNAVSAGEDADGRAMHVVRGSERLELACGVLRVGECTAEIPYYKIGSKHDQYEVLVNEGNVPLKWVKESCGNIVDGAIRAGTDRHGESIWAARVKICGHWVAGKLVESTKRAYGALDGIEYTRKKYEILCVGEPDEEAEEEEEEEYTTEKEDPRKEQVAVVDGLEWLMATDGEIPDCPVVSFSEGEKRTFIARVSEEVELVPGGVKRGEPAVVPYYKIAEDSECYDVLTSNGSTPLYWVPDTCGHVPEEALQCGVAKECDKIWAIRAKVDNCGNEVYAAGKVREGFESGYVANDGKEECVNDYEVLCYGESAECLDGATPVDVGSD